MSCSDLFVLTIYDDHILNTWVPLQTCLPGQQQNCGPNTYTFLNLMDRISGQMYSEISETTGLTETGQSSNNHNIGKGTAFRLISNLLTKKQQSTYTEVTESTNGSNKHESLLNFFNTTLKINQITILNVKNRYNGHILTIAKKKGWRISSIRSTTTTKI